MNETVEMSKLRGEISILKEELQRIKIVAEREKNRADAHSDSFADLQEELEATIKQRDELDREITCLHEKHFQQRVEKDREQYASNTRAHYEEKTGIDAILAEREKTHGSFETHAECTLSLEYTLYSFKGKAFYTPVMQEGLHMIFHNLGRIAAGCATHKDHWDDIAGYATLVSRSLKEEKE